MQNSEVLEIGGPELRASSVLSYFLIRMVQVLPFLRVGTACTSMVRDRHNKSPDDLQFDIHFNSGYVLVPDPIQFNVSADQKSSSQSPRERPSTECTSIRCIAIQRLSLTVIIPTTFGLHRTSITNGDVRGAQRNFIPKIFAQKFL